jgi:hypothetical protein
MTPTMAHRTPTDRSMGTPVAGGGPGPDRSATISPIDAKESHLGLRVEQATELLAGVVGTLERRPAIRSTSRSAICG